MSIEDFSNGFDVLLNSYAISATFGSTDNPATIEVDEYEKSVLLTQAQKDVALSLYSGTNLSTQGFEETEEIRRYLAPLICEATLTPITNTLGKPIGIDTKNSYFFSLPDGTSEDESTANPAVWFITYESVKLEEGKCGKGDTMQVVPVRQDEYHRIKKNPFRGANDRRALRLDLGDNNIEVVCKYKVTEYYMRYLREPKPILLVELADGLTLHGETTAQGCELHETLHQKILELAVQRALQTRGYNINNNENK
jgi:hypothetical protein